LVSEFNICLTNGLTKQAEENSVHYSETLLTQFWKTFNTLLSKTMLYKDMPDNTLFCNCVLKLTFTLLDSYSV